MMKVVQIAIVLVAVAVFSMPVMAQESNGSPFEHLKEPKISTQKNQKMLVVEAKGDPNVVGGKAFGLLFRLYYSMPETPKGPMQPAPRARWPITADTPKSTSEGISRTAS